MERNNFSDVFRDALVKELHILAFGRPQFLDDVETQICAGGGGGQEGGIPIYCDSAKEFMDEYPESAETIRRDARLVRERVAASFPAGSIARENYERDVKEARERLASIRQSGSDRVVRTDELISPRDSNPLDCGCLISKLLATGINPAGNDLKHQTAKWKGQNHPWTDLYDFGTRGWDRSLPVEADEKKNDVRKELNAKICDVLFSRLYFGFESSGLGYVKLRLDRDKIAGYAEEAQIPPNTFEEVCDSAIRILGDLYRHDASDYYIHPWIGYGVQVKPRQRSTKFSQ